MSVRKVLVWTITGPEHAELVKILNLAAETAGIQPCSQDTREHQASWNLWATDETLTEALTSIARQLAPKNNLLVEPEIKIRQCESRPVSCISDLTDPVSIAILDRNSGNQNRGEFMLANSMSKILNHLGLAFYYEDGHVWVQKADIDSTLREVVHTFGAHILCWQTV